MTTTDAPPPCIASSTAAELEVPTAVTAASAPAARRGPGCSIRASKAAATVVRTPAPAAVRGAAAAGRGRGGAPASPPRRCPPRSRSGSAAPPRHARSEACGGVAGGSPCSFCDWEVLRRGGPELGGGFLPSLFLGPLTHSTHPNPRAPRRPEKINRFLV
jgi:hypothetical protein